MVIYMAYLALYRKYRPTSFDEVFGQDNIVKIIQNAVVSGRVSHAYLFSGPRGTGKTTTAKILARMVNCESLDNGNPCGKCSNCLNFSSSGDVVEIDAASNNGVDEIRNLREKVNLVPSQSKYKIYIIDEVHMLTTQAFNALLKTLEEPPKHVIFILATTEPNKIPLTISSRCQKFQFNRVDDSDIVKRLKQISDIEKISISDDALYEIARVSDGGMRDSINLLDQLCSYDLNNITIDDVYNVYGTISYTDIAELLSNIKDNNGNYVVSYIEKINKDGINLSKFIEELLLFLKDVLVYKNCGNELEIKSKNDSIVKINYIFSENDIYYVVDLLNDLLGKLKYSVHPSVLLIANLLKLCGVISSNSFADKEVVNNTESVDNMKQPVEKQNNVTINNNTTVHKSKKILLPTDDYVEIVINNTFATASRDYLTNLLDKWRDVSEYIADARYVAISSFLADVVPRAAGNDYAILSGKYASIVDGVNSNLSLFERLLEDMIGHKVKVIALNDDIWEQKKLEYVNNRKSGKQYSLKDLPNINNTISDNDNDNSESSSDDMQVDFSNNPIDKLVNIVGEDVIEYI